VYFVDRASPGTSDLIAVTWKGAFRFDRAGNQKWAVKRDDSGWGQQMDGSLLVMWTKRHHYIGIDVATGQTRWTGELDTPGDFSLVRADLSSAATGVVLITTYDNVDTGPFGLNAFDATTGSVLWRMAKIDGDKIRNLMIDSTRLVVETDGQDREQYEIDLRSGATEEVGHMSRRRDSHATTGPVATGHYRVGYSRKRKTLTCYGPDGHVLWTRKGRLSENADFQILSQDVVVWPTQDGKVEFIALTSGTSLYTATGDEKPHVGVDDEMGRVLVPQGKQIKILTVTAGS
jgi:outer membrane protein assembly factor BamB